MGRAGVFPQQHALRDVDFQRLRLRLQGKQSALIGLQVSVDSSALRQTWAWRLPRPPLPSSRTEWRPLVGEQWRGRRRQDAIDRVSGFT